MSGREAGSPRGACADAQRVSAGGQGQAGHRWPRLALKEAPFRELLPHHPVPTQLLPKAEVSQSPPPQVLTPGTGLD